MRVNIADVRDSNTHALPGAGQDYIFNLAGQVSHLDSMRDPFTDLEINCRSQLSILEACRKHNPGVKVVFAGTRQSTASPTICRWTSSHLLHPTDVNGINKMAGEWYHILYNNVYGIRACSLRLTNTYGPRQSCATRARASSAGSSAWWSMAARSSIFGTGTQLRDFNYVDDVVDAFLLAGASDAAERAGLQPGRRSRSSLRDLAELLIEIAERGSLPARAVPAGAQGDRHRRRVQRLRARSRRRWAGSRACPCARGWRARSPITASITQHYW